MRRWTVLAAGVLLVSLSSTSFSSEPTFGRKVKRPKFSEFGNVVINNYCDEKGETPVVFTHWLHRSLYTCRLCHIDLGFAMVAGETDVTEQDNRDGMFCGACHDGKTAFGPGADRLAPGEESNCDRCHSLGKEIEFRHRFSAFKKKMPRGRFGNGIDWIAAEEQGQIKLIDYLEGYSVRRKKIQDPEDIQLSAQEPNMPDIIFSHKKHAVWSGCESCHPEIFPVKTGSAPYDMQEIFAGRFCGVCHDKVAFPNIDCQQCHTEDVY